jgi:3',5'-cyclic-AMP phosphodiesterase
MPADLTTIELTAAELTTVADDLAVIHVGHDVYRYGDLKPNRSHTFSPGGGAAVEVHTLPRPSGEMLSRFCTVNDVHFGEVECGRIDDHPDGPIQRAAPGDDPYPEVMNRGAIAEMLALDPDAVVVKGDLTDTGSDEQYNAFLAAYGAFGDRLVHVRGNHDAYHGQSYAAGDQCLDLDGVRVLLLDTVLPGESTGDITDDQIDWVDSLSAEADRPVIVMGHHQQWIEGKRSDDYFGLHPDASDALSKVVARRKRIIGYTAGHTHRHRVRMMPGTSVPSVEIGCVKDFPGTYAEYRVYEGGVMQVVHRISNPEALAWSEKCRFLYKDFGIDYATYGLGTLPERCFVFPGR